MTLALKDWGNGKALRLPQKLLNAAGFSAGDVFDANASNDRITLTVVKKLPTLKELYDGWDKTPPEKFDWGEPVGRELL